MALIKSAIREVRFAIGGIDLFLLLPVGRV